MESLSDIADLPALELSRKVAARQISVVEAVEYVLQACDAVAEAHALG